MELHEDILRSTGLLFKDEDNFPSPFGSCVFIKLSNLHFLITAAHVYDEGPSNLFLILHDKELTIGGDLLTTKLPLSGKRKDDKIDLAFIKIEDYIVNEISQRFKFIEIEEIEINHKLGPVQNYFVFGFPAKKLTHRMKTLKNITTRIFTFWSSPLTNRDYYLKNNYDYNRNILLRFNKKEVINKVTHQKQKAPDIEGISGCGLWYISNPNKVNTTKNLIGIIIEDDQNPMKKYLVATRIDVVTETIRKIYNIDIPRSKLVHDNVKVNT